MDRFSIIQQKVFNEEVMEETIACGEEECECINDVNDENLLAKAGRILDATFIAITLSVSAIMLILATKGSMGNMPNERNVVISCGTGTDYSAMLPDKNVPGDGDNGKICPHQQGALCENGSSKRRTLRFHSC